MKYPHKGQMPGDFPETKAQVPEALVDADKEINLAIAQVFGSVPGKKLMAWLHKSYLDMPCVGANGSVLDTTPYIREGQNSVVREMIKRIKVAQSYGK